MHRLSTSFILGYHGCDKSVADKLLEGAPFRVSSNKWEWLGEGIYFWEANPLRGLEWASDSAQKSQPKIKTPAVVGAVLDLRFCLDLTTALGIEQVQQAHGALIDLFEKSRTPASERPKNNRARKSHNLDCAVVNTLHVMREDKKLPPLDTVRGAFIEGEDAFPTSAFNTKTHIQICVRNPECIRGVFRVPAHDLVSDTV